MTIMVEKYMRFISLPVLSKFKSLNYSGLGSTKGLAMKRPLGVEGE
jgi:hypothetical protein